MRVLAKLLFAGQAYPQCGISHGMSGLWSCLRGPRPFFCPMATDPNVEAEKTSDSYGREEVTNRTSWQHAEDARFITKPNEIATCNKEADQSEITLRLRSHDSLLFAALRSKCQVLRSRRPLRDNIGESLRDTGQVIPAYSKY